MLAVVDGVDALLKGVEDLLDADGKALWVGADDSPVDSVDSLILQAKQSLMDEEMGAADAPTPTGQVAHDGDASSHNGRMELPRFCNEKVAKHLSCFSRHSVHFAHVVK